MKVEAKRDDGALLVTDGDAAIIVNGASTWITSKASALARGQWEPATGDVPEAATRQAAKLRQFQDELDAQESRHIS